MHPDIATVRARQLVRLRKALDLGQEVLTELSGIARSEISNAENGRLQWRSDALWTGLGQAFGMTREQLQEYLDGHMSIAKAMAIAHGTVAPAIERRRVEQACGAAAREALALADLTEDEHADAILLFLVRQALRHGPRVDRRYLSGLARICADRFRLLERDLHAVAANRKGSNSDTSSSKGPMSHKSVGETIRTRR
jgi:transcriptional regulator with XRE-family HTH domain